MVSSKRSLFFTFALIAVTIVFLFPLLSLLVAPLRPPGAPPPRGLELIPSDPSLRSFRDAFTLVPLARSILNSLIVTVIAVPITIVAASWSGLALRLITGRMKILIIGALVLMATVPMTAVWIPRFVMFDKLGLVGTYVPLIAPALMGGSPLFVLFYAVAFHRIPHEVFEAAIMEGCGALRLWRRVAMPLVKPTTAAIALLAAVTFWSNFIDPLLYLKAEEDLTAPLMIHSLDLLGPTNWPVFLAASLVITVPIIIAFFAAQRFFEGQERGGSWLGR
jgi:multiple sugar transport system permease protein